MVILIPLSALLLVAFNIYAWNYLSDCRCGNLDVAEERSINKANILHAVRDAVPEVNMIKFKNFINLYRIKPQHWRLYKRHVAYVTTDDCSDYCPLYFNFFEFPRYWLWCKSEEKKEYANDCAAKSQKFTSTTCLSWQKDIEEYRTKCEAEIAKAERQVADIAEKLEEHALPDDPFGAPKTAVAANP